MTITRFGVPKVHAAAVDGGFVFERTAAIEAVEAWLAEGAAMLVLAGDVGTGKSQAAALAVGRFWEESCAAPPFSPERRRGFPLWLPAPVINRFAHWDEAPKEWERAGILVLDDLGEEEATAKSVVMIEALVNARWGDELRTIITTNLTGKTFVERYRSRIVDRLRSSGLDDRGKARWWVTCTGQSLRGRVKPQEPPVPEGAEEDVPISEEAWSEAREVLGRMAAETAEAKRGPAEPADIAEARERLRSQLAARQAEQEDEG